MDPGTIGNNEHFSPFLSDATHVSATGHCSAFDFKNIRTNTAGSTTDPKAFEFRDIYSDLFSCRSELQ